MSEPTRFQRGDRVIHPRRPEWGDGVVREVASVTHQGQPAQRVTVQFANRGRTVINTAVAPLAVKDTPTQGPQEETSMTTSSTHRSGGWIESLEKAARGAQHELWELPEAMTDPFTSLEKRLQATLESYRFSTEPRQLIDWAVMQTGLNDPLSQYSRPELEDAFPGFARNRDQHLKALVKKLKDNAQTDALTRARHDKRTPQAAKQALDKLMRG